MSSNLMTNLKAINELSRLLLSQLDVRMKNTESDKAQQTLTVAYPETAENSQYTDEQLASLVTERQKLINQLFEMHTQEQLSVEQSLINEMVSLDKQLTSKSQRNKQVLAAQILKLKKIKKATHLYQKY